MKHGRIWIPVVALAVLAAGAWTVLRSVHGAAPVYRRAALERGNVESTISATGKLGAVTTVQVGTQVSGQVSAIYADFNDHVKKGQLIARIDPTLQEQAVREAQAGLQRNLAALVKAQSDQQRNQKLRDADVISDSDISTTVYALAVAQADARTGQVALDRAQRNLAYTSIRAPIDGIVIERDVDVGQTVAASLSAPQIFLIANTLTQMQILASVDESDVDRIHAGMPVRFTVQADARESFTGVVRQLRLQSTTTENVVNYTVVIGVTNPNGKLLPGMTATVAFLTGSASDVFLVPNAALRIHPTAAMIAQTGSTGAAPTSRSADTAPTGGTTRGAPGGRKPGAAGAGIPAQDGVLWFTGSDGKLATTQVKVGISDGQRTEVSGAGLVAGMQVIVGTTALAAGAPAGGSSPFQQPSGSGGPGPRGGF